MKARNIAKLAEKRIAYPLYNSVEISVQNLIEADYKYTNLYFGLPCYCFLIVNVRCWLLLGVVSNYVLS
jgi:hypothetical protein